MKFKFVLSGVLLVGLVACGGGSSDTPEEQASTVASPTPTPAPAATPTPAPTPTPTRATYGPVVTTVNGVDYCKSPLTDDEWSVLRAGRPDSMRAELYKLSPCTS